MKRLSARLFPTRLPEFISKVIFPLLFVGIIGVLGYSVFKAGYFYQFDGDELYHVQVVYLLMHGYKAFASYYATVYPPLFHWLLIPLFAVFGFSFGTIYLSHYVMIVIYILRTVIGFLLARELFGKRAALFFIPLYLLDPFTVYAGMQIRPDNFMILVFITGFYLLVKGVTRASQRLRFVGGLVLMGSVLVMAKMLPGVMVTLGLLLVWAVVRRKFSWFVDAFLGVILGIFLFLGYFYIRGSFPQMVQQFIIDPFKVYPYFQFPLPITFFYQPGNNVLYGGDPKPLSWIYAFILPFLGVAGIQTALLKALGKPFDSKHIFIIALSFVAIAQGLSLFFIQSVFMQYFLPVLFLFALLGGVALSGMFDLLVQNRRYELVVAAGFLLVLGIFTKSAYKTNMYRADITSVDKQKKFELRWQQIPPDEPVFQNLLFRPLAYPLPYYVFIGNIPEEVLSRYPTVEDSLAQHHIKYLLIDDYVMGFLHPTTRDYVTAHYERVAGDDELWKIKP